MRNENDEAISRTHFSRAQIQLLNKTIGIETRHVLAEGTDLHIDNDERVGRVPYPKYRAVRWASKTLGSRGLPVACFSKSSVV